MTILINCSDSLLGKFIAGRLTIDGNVVTLVDSDEDMVKTLGMMKFNLVIIVMDYRFGESDILLKLASEGVRFFILSGLNDEQSIYSAYEGGAVHYMSLPFDFSRFLLKVRELV